jgi:site-specific DNA-methyltransferase (adenine-specific)
MSAPKPYFDDGQVQLYVGDCREILPALGVKADCVVADPPYQSTSLKWDRWPEGWLATVAPFSRSLWCFGTLRLFMDRAAEFAGAGWKLSHDVIWEKEHGTGFVTDRFKGVHETAAHFYQGAWGSIRHETPKTEVAWRTRGNSGRAKPTHTGAIADGTWSDDGTRLARSVQKVPSMWKRGAIHPTEKPVPLLLPLIEYACPPGGLVIDPTAGSGSALDAARCSGRRAIGVEIDGETAREAARRLSQGTLFGDVLEVAG